MKQNIWTVNPINYMHTFPCPMKGKFFFHIQLPGTETEAKVCGFEAAAVVYRWTKRWWRGAGAERLSVGWAQLAGTFVVQVSCCKGQKIIKWTVSMLWVSPKITTSAWYSAIKISVMCDRRVIMCALDAYLLRCTPCVVIFACTNCLQTVYLIIFTPGFFLGGLGGPPSGENFANPPIQHLSPFSDQGLSPPAEVHPRKFEKFKYIFVSNLITFKLKSTLKSCISCLK